MNHTRLIGVISDTHGLLSPQAVQALQGSELILHAGDVGKPEVLDRLRDIAPVVAVRGNVDHSTWAQRLPRTQTVEIGKHRLYVIHNLDDLPTDPTADGLSAVISGHSHRPSIVRKNGVLYLNPGSGGPRRFNLPISVALLKVSDNQIEAELVELHT